jgi:SH3-like domain-containing protein
MKKYRRSVFRCALLMMVLGASLARAEEPERSLPRFASLRSGEANLRVGPGTRYPIRAVYRRAGMPVEILDEYGNWRQIRDVDGEKGWVHHGLLSGRRTLLVRGGARVLRRNPDPKAPPVLKAQPMVVGTLLRCRREWCYLKIHGYKGWMEKTAFWGVYAEEKF